MSAPWTDADVAAVQAKIDEVDARTARMHRLVDATICSFCPATLADAAAHATRCIEVRQGPPRWWEGNADRG